MSIIQEGPRDAKIVLVGEAPGAREAAEGKPFIGGSGDLLNEILLSAGVEIMRRDCFITNVCHSQPPRNDFAWFLRKTNQHHYLKGVIRLKQDLEEIRPNIVVALGGQALRALTKKIGIDKWRGSVIESSLVPGLKVMGTYHPAYALKLYDYKFIIEMDMRRAAQQMQFPEIRRRPRNVHTGIKWPVAKEMYKAEWLAVDIECFQQPDGSWKIACVGFSDHPERALVIPCDSVLARNIIQYLLGSPTKKIFQNGNGFDIFVLKSEGFTVKHYKWETMCGMHSLYPECASSEDETQKLSGRKKTQPALRKGLAFQISIWTDIPFYKDDGKLWQETGDLEMFWRYNGYDCMGTREVKDRQAEELTELGVWNVFEHEMSQLPVVMNMTKRGILIDMEVRNELRTQIETEIDNLQTFLDDGAGQPMNVKSNPQIAWLLFEKLDMPILKRSEKTQKPSCDKDVINRLAAKHPHPLLMSILEIRERRDLIERYLNVVADADGRMRCHFDVTGTRTGRQASRVSIYGTGTNLFNQPPKLRRMFVADPSKVMFSIDYSQAEARVVAWLARCEPLIELFNDPSRDVHRENAARFYHIPVEAVTFEQRYVAKRTIHASNYGMKPFKFWTVVNNDYRDTGIRITLREAEDAQTMYFSMYPEIKNIYWEEVKRDLYKTRALTTPLGRRRDFLGRPDEKFFNEAYSFIPQGTVGDMTEMAMVKVHHEVPEVELLITGYDSIIGQCAPEDVEATTRKVQTLMDIPLTIHGRELHIPTDVEVGYNWGKRKENKDGTVENPGGLRELDKWLQGTCARNAN